MTSSSKSPGRSARRLHSLVATWWRRMRGGRYSSVPSQEDFPDRLAATFQNAPIGLAHVAPDGRFLRVNAHFCGLMGYTEKELLERTFAAITHPEDLAADWERAHALLSGRLERYSMHKRYLRKDGDRVWAALHVALMRHADGKPDYFISAVRDITQQQESEEKLQSMVRTLAERDAQLERIFDKAEMGDWSWEMLRDRVEAHAIVFRQYGSPETDGPVPASWFEERQHPEDRIRIKSELQKAIESGSHFDFEFRVVQPDGSIRWVACRGSVQRNEQGQPIGTHGINVDITARKEAESAVRASELQLLTLTEVLPQLLWFTKPSGDVEFFNRQWYEYTGQTPDKALDWGWQPVIHPGDLVRCLSTWRNSLTSGEIYHIEYRLRRADGEYRWHLGRAIPLRDSSGAVLRWFGSCTDIHDLKSAETNLRSFHEVLERQVADRTAALVAATELNTRILESSPDCMQLLDLGGYLISSNAAGYRALQLEPSNDLTAVYWPSIWQREVRELAAAAIALAAVGEQGAFLGLQLSSTGVERWWDVRVTALYSSTGEPEKLLAVSRDITAQRRAEQDASEARQRMDLALRGAQIGGWTWDLESNLVTWHQQAAELFGLPADTVSSDVETVISLIHPTDSRMVRARLREALRTGHYDAEYCVKWPDGTDHILKAWAEVSFFNSKPVKVAGICWDITTRKRAENALQSSEARLREAQAIAQLGHWEFDLETRQVRWSEETFRIFGLTPGPSVTFEQYQSMLHEDDRQLVLAAVERATTSGTPFELTHRITRPNGSVAYVDARGRFESHGPNDCPRVLGTVLDVTARVQAELELRRSHTELELRVAERTINLRNEIESRRATEQHLRRAEQQLSVALKFSNVATWMWSNRNDAFSWTGPVEVVLGRSAGQLARLAQLEDLILPEDFTGFLSKLNQSVRTGCDFDSEFRIRLGDGGVRWIASRGGATAEKGAIVSMSGVIFDITERKLAEQDLAASEQRFRQLADGIPQIVWTALPNGEVDYANNTWCAYTGMQAHEIRNWGWGPTLHPDDLESCTHAWTTAFQTGIPYEVEIRVKRASDGVYRWHLARALPVRDTDGKIIKWLGTCPDIDDYKRASRELEVLNLDLEERVRQRSMELMESERRHRLLVEGIKDYSIFMLDPEGRISSWNAGAERIKQYRASEIIGKHFSLFYPAEVVASGHPERELSIASTEGAYREEGWRVRKDGSRFWASVLITRILDDAGHVNGFSKIVRDLTAQKEAEERIKAEQHRAEEASRAKSDFLATMSHEIRTPMNAILGMADLLWETELETDQRRYVEIFRRAGASLLTLVNDILDLSKIESGHFELEQVKFDLHDLVERTIDMVRPRSQVKRLHLQIGISTGVATHLIGDPTRLQQILLNLLGNAVKFTEKGSITLDIQLASDRPGHLRFDISDTGIGIPPGQLAVIFEDFTQAETSTTRRFGGTGLGLGICRRLVQRMNGALSARSEYGVGSTFSFTAQFEVAPQQKASEDINDLLGKQVLIVDENQTTRLIFSEMCENWGMQTYDCASHAEALEVLADAAHAGKPFHLAVIDRFVERGGFELAMESKSLYPSLNIVLTTSDDVPGEATRSEELGFAGYMTKPVRGADLLRLICGVLRGEKIRPEVTQKQAALPKAFEADTCRVLIAEDSEDNRFLIQSYLKNTRYKTVFAEDGQVALDMYRAASFDLVLMDIQMPVMDGLRAAREIRSFETNSGRKATPILALTANARSEEMQACRMAGFTSHLAKPISKSKLLNALDTHLPVAAQPAAQTRETADRSVMDVQIPPGLEAAAHRYIHSRQKDSDEMYGLLKEGKFERLRTLAHNMKGTGTPYGFPTVTELGAKLEDAARAKDVAAFEASLLCLKEYVKAAIVTIREGSK